MNISMENLLVNATILIFTLFSIFFILLQYRYNYWKRNGVPFLQPTILFGNAYDLFRKKISFGQMYAKLYHQMKEKGYKYAGFYFCTGITFVPIDLEVIKNIMNRDFTHFTDRGMYFNEKGEPITAHLFSLPMKQWKSLRAKISPAFTSGKLKGMFQILLNCGQELNAILEETSKGTEPFDAKDIAARFTSDVIGSCAFGIDCNSLNDPNTEFRKYGKKAFEYSLFEHVTHLLEFCFPEFMLFFNAKMFSREVSDFFMGVVRDAISYRERHNIKRMDFLHLLLKLQRKENIEKEAMDNEEQELENGKNSVQLSAKSDESMTDKIFPLEKEEDGKEADVSLTFEQIAAQCFILFLGGFESSSTTLTFCLFELSRNMDIQIKLREEIIATMDKHDGQITYDSIMEMHYMDSVIYETIRKYPPLSVINRICTKDYVVPETGLRIEKGTTVVVPILAIHNDPEYYPDPEKFDPDRFTEENKQNRHPYAYIPFGKGPRMCIGIRFAMMETKVGLTILLRHFQYSLNDKVTLPLELVKDTITTNIQNGMWLNVQKI